MVMPKTSLLMELSWRQVASLPMPQTELQTHRNCWIEIFGGDNFMKTILRSQRSVFATGTIWPARIGATISNALLWSNATVVPEDKDSRGRNGICPGQRVANLGKLDMANNIESLKITCESG
jgi:hypothetical protein